MTADTADTLDTEKKPAEDKPQLTPLLEKVIAGIGSSLVLEHHTFRGDDRIHIDRANVVEVMRRLRDDSQLAFDLLLDVTAIDYLGQPDDFEERREIWDQQSLYDPAVAATAPQHSAAATGTSSTLRGRVSSYLNQAFVSIKD